MPRYRIFDPKVETLEAVKKKLDASKDLVTKCELALYLRNNPKSSRHIVVFSYCLTTAMSTIDELRIAQANSGESNLHVYEAKLEELTSKLKLLKAQPKDTKTYKALLESLTRQHLDYSRLVDFGDVPAKYQKQIATLELILKRIDECIDALSKEGVTYEHLEAVFPRISQLMEDE